MNLLSNKTKRYALFAWAVLLPLLSMAQSLERLGLDEAYQLLEARYPQLQDRLFSQQILEKEMRQEELSRLPQVSLMGEGRLQSEATSFEAEAPIPLQLELPLYSARGYLEVNYNVLDHGLTDARVNKLKAEQHVADQQLEIDLYALRKRVDQLFIQSLMLKEQGRLYDLSLKDLNVRKENLEAAFAAGTLLESNLTQLEIQLIELKAQKEGLDIRYRGMLNSLETLLGVELKDNVELEFPVLVSPNTIPEITRPEFRMFEVRRQLVRTQEDFIGQSRKPRLVAFAQGGVGYPNPLNLFDTNVSPYGLVGFRFQWKLTDWGKSRLQREVLHLHEQRVQTAEETFLFNMASQEAAYLAEVEALEARIVKDQEIIELQTKVLSQMGAQLDEGVITSSDYLIQSNAELRARQNLVLHRAQLLQTQIQFRHERGSN